MGIVIYISTGIYRIFIFTVGNIFISVISVYLMIYIYLLLHLTDDIQIPILLVFISRSFLFFGWS